MGAPPLPTLQIRAFVPLDVAREQLDRASARVADLERELAALLDEEASRAARPFTPFDDISGAGKGAIAFARALTEGYLEDQRRLLAEEHRQLTQLCVERLDRERELARAALAAARSRVRDRLGADELPQPRVVDLREASQPDDDAARSVEVAVAAPPAPAAAPDPAGAPAPAVDAAAAVPTPPAEPPPPSEATRPPRQAATNATPTPAAASTAPPTTTAPAPTRVSSSAPLIQPVDVLMPIAALLLLLVGVLIWID